MRMFFKIAGVITVLIVVVLIWALDRVDQSPLHESDYYIKSKARFDSISDGISLAKGKVYVGAGKANITPGLNSTDNPEAGVFKEVPLAGFGKRKGAPATGVHDSLFVKAIAIRVEEKLLVMIGSDILIVPPNISDGVSRVVYEKLGIRRDQLFFSATHTHSSVGAWGDGIVGESTAGKENPNVITWLIAQYSKAIEYAIDDLKPGRIGTGGFNAPEFNRNRLIKENGEKNSEFVYILISQDEGEKIIIGSFDAHATTLGAWNLEFSADYPGYWQRKLENEIADMAVFFAGSVGSHSAVSKGEKFERPRYLGEALADSVIKYSHTVELSDSIGLSHLSVQLDLPEFNVRISDDIRVNPNLADRLFMDVGDVYIQSARIGNLIWITSPCDMSGEMAIVYKNAMAKDGYKVIVTSFNGSYIGYIVPDKYYHLDNYETRLMSWFGPTMSPFIDEIILQSMQKLDAL
ncbi:neutral/alkaline non-lysosomal ceramidase N-terminal domain-containing protein [Bacteroidota bacterium]